MLSRCIVIAVVAACTRPSPTATPAAARPAAQVPAGALDPMLTTYAYPYPVATFELRSQQQALTMAYLDVAPTGTPNGRTALLLHGKNFSAAYWAPTIRVLADAGFRVIAPDQIGFGKSSKPARYQFTFEQLVANTRALLHRLGVDRVTVVGHSMGGMLAVRFALGLPARTERLVLVNPIGLEDWRQVVPVPTIDEVYAQQLAATPDSIRAYQRAAYYDGAWTPAYEQQAEILIGWTRHPDYARVAWNAALTADMVMTQPVLYDFPRIAVPTLLIIGQRDRTALGKTSVPKEVAAQLGDYPVLGRRAAERIPGAKLVELDGIGHMPQVEAFDAYAAALLAFVK